MIINIENKKYERHVEMIGDVEKISWYELKEELSDDFVGMTWAQKEIYDQDELFELEHIYVGRLLDELTPTLPII